MRKLLILLVFLCSCASAERKFVHPSLTLPQLDMCLLDTKFPDQLMCKHVFNWEGKPKTWVIQTDSHPAYLVMTIKDASKVIAFMRTYCRENKRACGKLAKQLRKYDKE